MSAAFLRVASTFVAVAARGEGRCFTHISTNPECPSKNALIMARSRGRASVLSCDFLKPRDKSAVARSSSGVSICTLVLVKQVNLVPRVFASSCGASPTLCDMSL